MFQDIKQIKNQEEALSFFLNYKDKLGRFNNSAREAIRTATEILEKPFNYKEIKELKYTVSSRLWDTYDVLTQNSNEDADEDKTRQSWPTTFSDLRNSKKPVSRYSFILIMLVTVPLAQPQLNDLLLRCGFLKLNEKIPFDYLVTEIIRYIQKLKVQKNLPEIIKKFLDEVYEIAPEFVQLVAYTIKASHSAD